MLVWCAKTGELTHVHLPHTVSASRLPLDISHLLLPLRFSRLFVLSSHALDWLSFILCPAIFFSLFIVVIALVSSITLLTVVI